MSVAFEPGRLNHKQTLPIAVKEMREFVESLVNQPGVEPDKRFVYYLLGATGVCVVPLSSFATDWQGFRVTLLEKDEARFTKIFETIGQVLVEVH